MYASSRYVLLITWILLKFRCTCYWKCNLTMIQSVRRSDIGRSVVDRLAGWSVIYFPSTVRALLGSATSLWALCTSVGRSAAFRIHLIWRGSGSWDPHLGKVDPDPQIHLSVIVDPDPVPKWIRIRVPIFHIFHIEIHVGQIKMLISNTAKI